MNATDHDTSSAIPNAVNEAAAAAPPFSRCVRWMILTEQTLSAIFLLAIVGTMGAQVFARYFFGAPFSDLEPNLILPTSDTFLCRLIIGLIRSSLWSNW